MPETGEATFRGDAGGCKEVMRERGEGSGTSCGSVT